MRSKSGMLVTRSIPHLVGTGWVAPDGCQTPLEAAGVLLVGFFGMLARNGGDLGAGEANSVKALARNSGDLQSALTEFAPALRCHYPGQAGF